MMGIGIGDDGDLPKAVAMEVLLREINGWTTVDQGWTTVVPGLGLIRGMTVPALTVPGSQSGGVG